MLNINKSDRIKFDNTKLLRRKDTRIIILHHRCGVGDVNSIHLEHINRGWAGIGYHFYIRTNGEVWEGRPTDYVGAHCNHNNSYSIGICFEGDFRKTQPTQAQLDSCRELVAKLRRQYPNINKVLNHKDLYATLCPVVNLKELIK